MSFIRYSVNNPVAVNIIMFAVLFFGLYKGLTITREFFPPIPSDIVLVTVPYPGATPEEVESGVVTRLEQAIEGVDGIDQVTARALENIGLLQVKVVGGFDPAKVADDIRLEVERIRDMPSEAEDPVVEPLELRIPVISVVVFGTADELRLKRAATEVRDELLASRVVSQAEISGVRAEEISIEVEPERMEAFGLTFEEIGRTVRDNNIDLAGGEIKSPEGNILIRTLGEEDTGLAIEKILLRSDMDGRSVRLGDVASVRDGFEEAALRGTFQGQRAMQVTIFKRGDEDSILISNYVKDYLDEKSKQFEGEAIQLKYRVDYARFIEQRLAMLTKNALQGLGLVLLALILFLSLRLAFWVAVGLFVAFLGTFVAMDLMGVTVNLFSLFGLILVIGLIVDALIVVAENIYARIERDVPAHLAALEGATEVAAPVTATVLTSVVAFAPLAFVEGILGDLFIVLPLVVIAALSLSLVECFLILPSHLAEFGKPRLVGPAEQPEKEHRLLEFIRTTSERMGTLKERVLGEGLRDGYVALLRICLSWRYVTVAGGVFVSMLTAALLVAGYLPFVLLQRVDADSLVVELEMTSGTPAEETEKALDWIASQALELDGIRNVFSAVGSREEADVQIFDEPAVIGEVVAELFDADERDKSSDTILNEWRERVGHIPGAVSLRFRDRAGGPGGREIDMKVSGPDYETVEAAVRYIREVMARYEGVRDVEDDGGTGKLEFRVRMRESARALGLSTGSIAWQLRGAFFGYEAQALQRADEEVKVWVRLNEQSRRSIEELPKLRVSTPGGDRVPISEIAGIELARGVGQITRIDGRRTISVFADVDYAVGNTAQITNALIEKFADIGTRFPGVEISFEGAHLDTAEGVGSLAYGFPIALVVIYCILAVLFKSYIQPILVMTAIPFALVGAALGHLLFGLIPGREMMPLTFSSLLGMVGLSGVVVNGSLILMTFVNKARRERHENLFEVTVKACKRRFRPIMLTSVTTVAGLIPIMMETSFQAQFLIPTAISMSFGLALATAVTLLLLPCFYLILEDIKTAANWLVTGRWETVELNPEEYLEKELESTS